MSMYRRDLSTTFRPDSPGARVSPCDGFTNETQRKLAGSSGKRVQIKVETGLRFLFHLLLLPVLSVGSISDTPTAIL